MGKVPKNTSFYKLNKQLLRELGPFEAILLAYIDEFHDKGLPCFASRAHIAAETGFAERTIQNLINKLVQAGYIAVSYNGRQRIMIRVNRGGIKCSVRGQQMPREGALDAQMRGQEMLSTKINNTKINNTKINLLSPEHEMPPVDNSKNKYQIYWDPTKQVMVRKRLAD